jgi:diadenosine tetraphosphate (Ap4A) HIT family hydrolase
MGCTFCGNKDIQNRIIIENDFVWAIPTNIPITIGHTLIMPKRCVQTFAKLTLEETKSIFDFAEEIKKALMKKFHATGFNVAWNEGKVAGQSVPHFHLHIVPRSEGDTGIHKYEPREFLYRPGSREPTPEQELQAVANTLKNALQNPSL